ncbi:hypothetical protein P3B99_001875 [Opitutia bacterium KCR 482]|nr:hypothetical protein [Opitutae bacterium KCR 482]
MSDEQTPPPFPENTAPKPVAPAQEAPKAAPAATPVAQVSPAPAATAPTVSATPVAPAPAAARPAAAAPKFDLPKAKYGIANKAGAPVQVQVKKSDNPSILSVAIDGLAAAVAVAFAVLIILDI